MFKDSVNSVKNDDQKHTSASSPAANASQEKAAQSVKAAATLAATSGTSAAPVQTKQEAGQSFVNTQSTAQKQVAQEGNLPHDIRMKMERSFATDFSGVEVHQHSEAAKNLNAIAFTQGNEIHFAPGYNPYSSQGQEYLGHELQHVIQQQSGIVATTHQEQGFNVNFNEVLESEADTAGRRAAAGQHVNAGSKTPGNQQPTFVQKKSATIQLLRQPIPASSFILDVNTTPDIVLQDLIHVASLASRQYSDVNWRQLFYPAIEAQIRGKQLGSISHAWTDTSGLDFDWEVNISFSMENPVRTARPEETRPVVTSQGGSSTPSLGSSQTVTTGQTASGQGTITNAPGGVGQSGNVTVGVNDSTARGQSQGAAGSITGGQSQTSQERVSRYRANLYTTISVRTTAGYSNWDIVNPVKWGAHLAGNLSAQRTLHIGAITYDQPNF